MTAYLLRSRDRLSARFGSIDTRYTIATEQIVSIDRWLKSPLLRMKL